MKLFLAAVFLLVSSLVTTLAQQAPASSTTPSSSAKDAAQAPSTNPTTPQPSVTPPTPGKPSTPPTGPQAGTVQSATPPDYSQEAYVVEHSSQKMRYENDGTGSLENEAQIKIISESGVQALGQLKVGYNAMSEKLEIAYVRVRKPDGSVVNAQESAVQDLTFPDAPVYTDYHEKHISVPSLRPGDVLEYRFVHTIASPLAPGQFWTSYNFVERGIVLDEQLEINVPKDRQIKLKTKPGYDAKITDDGDRRIYRWTHSNLKDEDDKKKKKKKTDDESATVELTTFKSWDELGAWYASLEHDRRVPDASVKAEAAVLVKGKSDDMAKVKALYDYVSRNIRYVSLSFGLGRIQPHAASEVLANGYGDCKDKNTLLAALLDAEGFHSTSVLIGSHMKLDPDIPSPSQFDHVITRVPVDGKEIWLDSTPGVAPFRMLSAQLRDKQALAIPPDGNAVIVTTPAELPFQAFDRTNLVGSLSDTGTLTAHINTASRGDTEIILRYAMRRMPSSHWKDIFEYMLTRAKMQHTEITNLKASDPSNTDDPLTIEFDVTASNYFDWAAAESKFVLPLGSIHLPDEDTDEDDDSTSTEPIKLGAIRDDQADVKITFPAKYQVHAPLNVDLKRDYAEYHSVYKFDAGTLTSQRTLKVAMSEIPESRKEDYAAFRRVVGADEAQQVTLESQSPAATGVAGGGDQSADDLFAAAIQAYQNQHFQTAADLLERVVKLDPKHKGAWDDLGDAYMNLGQTDKAIAAFKQQIEINPYDAFAYNALGQAYQRLGRYQDAIEQYHKQIEVNPLDPYAHASLGQLHLGQKKFSEAVPELEKAVDIQPKNPLLEIALGQAYIGTNQTDKGMAAFEKAISISATPLVWNNIAYSLSEQNVQLDRAQQYADSAINALNTQLRDVNLDSLRVQDLGTANLLFAVWDTRGWVDFKRGDLDTAEKYILPAWEAGGSGDEAEHLGDMADKRGQRDDAINDYVLSLLSEDPSLTARAKLTAMGVKDIDRRMDAAKAKMAPRKVALNKSDKGTAEFFLLVSPGKVEQVKFIKGDGNLKAFADILQKTDVQMKFPPQSQTDVVRRAVVRCGTTSPGPCTVELVPSTEVRSLE